MPRTVDHLVAIHELVGARKRAGKPAWADKVDLSAVYHSDALSFEERRDVIVAILRRSRWIRGVNGYGAAANAVEELAVASDEEEFNGWMDELYDEADWDRVWIKTRA